MIFIVISLYYLRSVSTLCQTGRIFVIVRLRRVNDDDDDDDATYFSLLSKDFGDFRIG